MPEAIRCKRIIDGKTYNTEPAVANGCKGGGKSKANKTANRTNKQAQKSSLLAALGAGW